MRPLLRPPLLAPRLLLLPALAAAGTVDPYTNASFLDVLPFGVYSHWIQPWRSYTSTPHVSALLDGVGIVRRRAALIMCCVLCGGFSTFPHRF